MRSKFFILFLISVFLITSGLSCKKGNPQAEKAIAEKKTLKIWGVFDSSTAFREIISNYRASHPYVNIEYTKIRWEDYEDKVLEAWAEREGPDIFAIHNTWIGKYQNKIEPMPERTKIAKVKVTGSVSGIKQDTEAYFEEKEMLSPYTLRQAFPEVVYNDFVIENKIYGLPLSIDTLALFYNRDHYNATGIVGPPVTWQEFTQYVKKLTLQNSEGEISRSAVAIGTAKNINRSNDILSLLMLQNGTQMTSGNRATFDEKSTHDRNYLPGQEALRFYTDFASPSKEVYTWNQDMPEALEAFSAGKTSMMFGYAYQLPIIKTQAPSINFGIAPVPHIKESGTDANGLPINFANYWAFSVFKHTQNSDLAWDFLQFSSTSTYQDQNGEIHYQAEKYIESTNKPPALRQLLPVYSKKDPDLAVFTNQILTSQSWYHGKSPDQMNKIFKQMITDIVEGNKEIDDAIEDAASAVSRTYY